MLAAVHLELRTHHAYVVGRRRPRYQPCSIPPPRLPRRRQRHRRLSGCVSSTSTQSLLPALLFPGVENWREPVFARGEPLMFLKIPFVGSYHRAVTLPENLDISAVIVAAFGQ